jgi:hypothetical protein
VDISKKSLDDYLFQIRFGHKYKFNFNQFQAPQQIQPQITQQYSGMGQEEEEIKINLLMNEFMDEK